MNDLSLVELLRWTWRQLTSMRTALVLLLLLALAAVPGSLIPQADVDALKASQWQDNHPKLTPIYEKLGLFDVYASPWFAAIYLLLTVSLVGCIIPRTKVYFRAMRARPPRAPRHLTRLGESASYETEESVDEVLARAEKVLGKRRFRRDRHDEGTDGGFVAAERGYLREAGNLVFHLSILVVMAGVAAGSLFGYQGGAIILVGGGFSNNLTQYDDFVPGGLYQQEWMEPFAFDIADFELDWLTSGAGMGQARNFVSKLRYTEEPGAEEKTYDLRVNHPLTIGSTDIFLIGHGYAPVITVRDADGEIAISGATPFLPTDQNFRSFGVVKATDAKTPLALEGEFYPTYVFDNGPQSTFGDLLNPLVSMEVWTGDLGLDDGRSQSVYVLDKAKMTKVTDDGEMFRLDMRPGDTVELPGDLGSVTFERVERWNKIQISQTPGKFVALAGVVLALLGLVGSLYVRPRRVWVRARRVGGTTLVEIGGLDRSSGGDIAEEIESITAELAPAPAGAAPKEQS
ncbi:cytochrome c biogenesis protein ResB [Nocardioides daphniae]|uniref:Cytochrome c biosynthesis protein n=1 Tax=Nocardioides daphniae TaxID=402297 RepID=A0ABQ1Q9S5_9ACTN|nr:cytochrome c biogenesis protein ResB [Nocardioides daphniae]GGD20450.1 cytochrome c biosynthesis protein [Nocardioides daphniae]